jgi:hypothetical protein
VTVADDAAQVRYVVDRVLEQREAGVTLIADRGRPKGLDKGKALFVTGIAAEVGEKSIETLYHLGVQGGPSPRMRSSAA